MIRKAKLPEVTMLSRDIKHFQLRILNCRGGTIITVKSDLAGFGIKQDCLNGLIRELNTLLLIPSQQFVREGLQGLATGAGLDVSKSIALSNATNITVMFTKWTNEITYFDNIMYQNVQLTINNVKYPDTEFDSTIVELTLLIPPSIS